MPIPSNKKELLDAYQDTYSKFQKELEGLALDVVELESMIGHKKGSLMSVSDLVSYLIGWGELVLKWDTTINKGEMPDMPETGYSWNTLGDLAQKFYRDYESLTYIEKREKLQIVQDELVELIRVSSNEELYEQPWYDKWTKGRLIQLNTVSPFRNARTRIRKWRKENGY